MKSFRKLLLSTAIISLMSLTTPSFADSHLAESSFEKALNNGEKTTVEIMSDKKDVMVDKMVDKMEKKDAMVDKMVKEDVMTDKMADKMEKKMDDAMDKDTMDKKDAHHDWSHAHPEKWGMVAEACDTGKMQSPIDIAEANALADVSVDTKYGKINGTAIHNAHTVQVDLPKGQYMMSDRTKYNLLQFHMHTPSEHVISGETFPMTAHFVHTTDKGALGVLGVMFEKGEHNAELQAILDALKTDKKAPVELNTANLIPKDTSVFRYMGSLTTPPCSEGVNWHIARESITMSAAQIEQFTKMMGMNARPVQDLNNRLLVRPK